MKTFRRYLLNIILALALVLPTVVLFDVREVFAVSRNLYWVGNRQTWNATAGNKWALTSGGAGGEAVPDSDDNVFFDALSFATGTIDRGVWVSGSAYAVDDIVSYAGIRYICTTAINPSLEPPPSSGNFYLTRVTISTSECNNLNTTGYIDGFINSGSTGVYGNVTLDSTNLSGYGSVTFKSTSTGKTITSDGSSLGTATFNGVGGGWTLQDALGCDGITVTNGTFNTGNFTITGTINAQYQQSGGTANLGTSTFNGFFGWNITGGTLDADSTTINLNSTNGATTFTGNGNTYNIVSLSVKSTWDPDIKGANTFTNLSIIGQNDTNENVTIYADQVITGTLTMTGYNATNKRMLISSNTLGTSRQLTATTVTVSNCNIRDIAGNPPATPSSEWDISAGLNSDFGGNYGIIFTVPQNNYWVGNSGNWSDVTHWASTTGGGSGTGRVPLPQDTAIFDANSITIGARTVTMDMTDVSSINALSVANTPTFSATTIYIYGSLDLGIATWSVTTTYFTAPYASTIKSVSSLAAVNISAHPTTGVCSLAGDVTSTGTVTLTTGTFDLNGHNLTASAFASTGADTRGLLLGEGIFTLNSAAAITKWNVVASLNMQRETGTIVLTSSAANAQTFAGAGLTYGNVTIKGAGNYAMSITGANTFADLRIERNEAAKTVKFPTSTTTTVSNLYIPIYGTTVVTLVGTTAPPTALVWTITKTSGVVVTDYLSLEDSTAAGGATFYSGSHSTHVSHVTGWNLSDPTAPIVSTSAVSDVGSNKVTFNGELVSIGGVAMGDAYFQWDDDAVNYANSTAKLPMEGAGTFSQLLEAIAPATAYYVRAVFEYSGGTKVYGSGVSFTTTTADPDAPVVVTGVASNVKQTTATLQGTLSDIGIYTTVYVAFDYRPSTSSTWTRTGELTKTAVTGYTTDITDLTSGTTYYFRAVGRYVSDATSLYVFGAEVTFSFSSLSIITAKVFRGYLETNDMLIGVEYINNTSPYAPLQDPTIYFAMQLLGTNGSTVLASTPIQHWGDSASSIYLSAASSATLTNGGAYYVRMIGLYTSPVSTSYQLTANDWRGSNLVYLDKWVINTAYNIQDYSDLTGDDAFVTLDRVRGNVLTDNGGAYVLTCIPYLDNVRPDIFLTRSVKPSLYGGTPNLTYDTSEQWEKQVGPTIATDMNTIGTMFGVSGQTFNGWLYLGIILIVMGVLLANGGVLFGGLLIASLFMETGNYFRAIPIQYSLVLAVAMTILFIASFWWQLR